MFSLSCLGIPVVANLNILNVLLTFGPFFIWLENVLLTNATISGELMQIVLF